MRFCLRLLHEMSHNLLNFEDSHSSFGFSDIVFQWPHSLYHPQRGETSTKLSMLNYFHVPSVFLCVFNFSLQIYPVDRFSVMVCQPWKEMPECHSFKIYKYSIQSYNIPTESICLTHTKWIQIILQARRLGDGGIIRIKTNWYWDWQW